MRIIRNSSFLQKMIISLCVIVLLFNFICPIQSQADELGVLVGPFTYLFKLIADAVVGGLQYYFVGGPIRTFWVMMDPGDEGDEGEQETLKKLGIISDKEQEPLLDRSGLDEENKIVDWGKSVELDEPEQAENFNSFFEAAFQGAVDFITGKSESDRRYDIPMIVYTPEAIFSNKIRAFDIDFINPNSKTRSAGYDLQETTMGKLQENISNWYNALRLLAAACMLPILVYVGIRIIIGSVNEKAKYKAMLMDWLVAMCLLFVMHYIMAFIINITESITNIVGTASNSIIVPIEGDGTSYFRTNLMGLIRFRSEYKDLGSSMPNIIMYIMMVVFTVIFTWTYLKRTLMIAFLTLIAPIITVTYPIDKLGDGKSQGFDIWLKEYLFNALIQPFHLILYTVLIGGAVSISKDNPILAIAAMAFLLPAEKLLKKMFNFDKASTGAAGGSLATAAVGGLNLASNLKQLKQLGNLQSGSSSGSGNGKSGNNTSGTDEITTTKPRFNSSNLAISGENNNNDHNDNNVSGGVANNVRNDNNPSELEDINSRRDELDNKWGYSGYYGEDAEEYAQLLDRQEELERQEAERQEAERQEAEQRALVTGNESNQVSTSSGRFSALRNTGEKVWNSTPSRFVRLGTKKAGKTVGKTALRLATALPGAVAGAAVGGAIGLATGDLSKAASIAVGGALATDRAARYTVKSMGTGARNTLDEARYLNNPAKYEKKQTEKQKRRYMKNSENYNKAVKMASNLGITDKEEISKIQEKMFDLNRWGINDAGDQEKALSINKKHGIDLESVAWAMDQAKTHKDLGDDKKRAAYEKDLIMGEMDKGYSEQESTNLARAKVALVREINTPGAYNYMMRREPQQTSRGSQQQNARGSQQQNA